jgi:hypothetical protein
MRTISQRQDRTSERRLSLEELTDMMVEQMERMSARRRRRFDDALASPNPLRIFARNPRLAKGTIFAVATVVPGGRVTGRRRSLRRLGGARARRAARRGATRAGPDADPDPERVGSSDAPAGVRCMRADLHIRGSHHIFEAEDCCLEGPWVHLSGHSRRRVGIDHKGAQDGDGQSVSRPNSEVASIRWATP